MRDLVARVLFAAIVLMLAGCGGENGEGLLLPFPGLGGGEAAYDISIEGEIEPGLRDKLEASSQLIALRTQAPASCAALRRRIAGDIESLGSVLRAEGYYAGAVTSPMKTTCWPKPSTPGWTAT